MSESNLKEIVKSGTVKVVYVHGPARSGSTILEVCLSQLFDCVIHQPWRGILHNQGGRLRSTKLAFDEDVYQAGCHLIYEHTLKVLEKKSQAIILVKELSSFFKPPIWYRWIKIPEKFILTIRDPHLQYLSWLSAMTDKFFEGKGSLQEDDEFVLKQAEFVEDKALPYEWEGTTISCNRYAWDSLWHSYYSIRDLLPQCHQNLAIVDNDLLRKDPHFYIQSILQSLGLECHTDDAFLNNLHHDSMQKIVDVRDINRPMVRKARNSNMIHPLIGKYKLNPSFLPSKSQQHLQDIIPIYLDCLYASEHRAIPSLQQLDEPVYGSENCRLDEANPFLAYAIGKFYKSTALLDELRQNFHYLEESFETVDFYCKSLDCCDQ